MAFPCTNYYWKYNTCGFHHSSPVGSKILTHGKFRVVTTTSNSPRNRFTHINSIADANSTYLEPTYFIFRTSKRVSNPRSNVCKIWLSQRLSTFPSLVWDFWHIILQNTKWVDFTVLNLLWHPIMKLSFVEKKIMIFCASSVKNVDSFRWIFVCFFCCNFFFVLWILK